MNMFIFFFLFLARVLNATPEQQIIVIDHFIPPEMARALIQYYNEKQSNLQVNTDNEIPLSSISNPEIKRMIFEIGNQVLRVMREQYPLAGRNYRIDHAGLYARIKGNYCPYHADNIYFECPIHGKDQGRLRRICSGHCPGAKFVPNHTSWREYTALIYLNDNFEGGEIAFEDGPCIHSYKKVIPIRENMLILAPNGANFYHEVYPIRSGKRYSLHLWFRS